jgi:hypothetical protein
MYLLKSIIKSTILSTLLVISGQSREIQSNPNCKKSNAALFNSINQYQELTITSNYQNLNSKNHTIFMKKSIISKGEISYKIPNQRNIIRSDIELNPRGIYRFQNCEMRPLKITISKEGKGNLKQLDKSNLFKKLGRKIKMVNVCKPFSGDLEKENRALLKEYYIYQIVSLLTPYALNSRLVKIRYQNPDVSLYLNSYAILLEPEKSLRKRCKMRKEPSFWVSFSDDSDEFSRELSDYDAAGESYSPNENISSKLNFELINQFIGNGDYELIDRHNTISMVSQTEEVFFAPYDFDSSDIINGERFQQQLFKQWISEQKAENRTLLFTLIKKIISKKEQISMLISNSILDDQGRKEMIFWLNQAVQTLEKSLSDSHLDGDLKTP